MSNFDSTSKGFSLSTFVKKTDFTRESEKNQIQEISLEHLIEWKYNNKQSDWQYFRLLSGFFIKNAVSQWQSRDNLNTSDLQEIKEKLDGKAIYTGFNKNYELLQPIHLNKIYMCKNKFSDETFTAKFCSGRNMQIYSYLSNFPHKNILLAKEMFKEEDQLILITDYCQGGSLQDYFINSQYIIPLTQIRNIMKSLLFGLEHLHKNQMMHRDVKLSNIIFQEQFDLKTLKLIDFEFVTFLNEADYLDCGTEGYIAPEVKSKEKYNEKCDIYSSGIVFYILLFGERPKKSIKIDMKEIRFFSDEESSYEIALNLLSQMLMKDPKNRSSAAQCLQHQFLRNSKIILQKSISLNIMNLDSVKFKNPFQKLQSFSES